MIPEQYDAVVVGAGFSGLYMLHRLCQAGLSTQVYEAGSDVGGVWYWNRYPGAKCDIESIYYNYTFSEELYREWTWTSRYPDQPSILRYIKHVADKFDLRRNIQFNTRVLSAHYDETEARWLIATDDGRRVSAKYFISGVGCLSAANTPNFAGLERFRGQTFHTGAWPHEPVDFSGLRVGVIGTGSSGVQAIPVIAEQAGHLHVFQRTPQYTTPAVNHAYDADYLSQVRENLAEVRVQMQRSALGFPRAVPQHSALAVSPQERDATYEANWQRGGWMTGCFNDLVSNPAANETVGEFIRGKINAIVSDPDVARKLMPSYYYGGKRPVLDSHYFETYNRTNVTLVDVKSAPIIEITEQGLRTSEQEYALDALVFATGYDAITGPLFRIDIRGRGGVSLKEKWGDGGSIQTYLGLATAGFPNFFTITGPESPSVLTNMVLSIEQHVEWISDCLAFMHAGGFQEVEATAEAEQDWGRRCKAVADLTLMPRVESWYTGANVEGKPKGFPIFVGGANTYREICDKVAAEGYSGFTFCGSTITTMEG